MAVIGAGQFSLVCIVVSSVTFSSNNGNYQSNGSYTMPYHKITCFVLLSTSTFVFARSCNVRVYTYSMSHSNLKVTLMDTWHTFVYAMWCRCNVYNLRISPSSKTKDKDQRNFFKITSNKFYENCVRLFAVMSATDDSPVFLLYSRYVCSHFGLSSQLSANRFMWE